MATYTNPSGYVAGTSEDDQFLFDKRISAQAFVEGKAGRDRIYFNQAGAEISEITVEEWFGQREFGGRVTGVYGPVVNFTGFEEVEAAGTDNNDLFKLRIGEATLGLVVRFNGGLGSDRLIVVADGLTSSLQLVVDGAEISSNLGDFTSFEEFHVTSGSGDDVIRTGNGRDQIIAGSGADTVHAGGGMDSIHSAGGGDTIDGGDDYDHWSAGFGADGSAVVIDFGSAIVVSEGSVGYNIESVYLGTGSGADVFNINAAVSGTLDGGSGVDTVNYMPGGTSVFHARITADSAGLHGSSGNLSFHKFEILNSGSANDTFGVIIYPGHTA